MMSIEEFVPADRRVYLPRTGVTLIDVDLAVPEGMTPEEFLETTSAEGRTLREDMAGFVRDVILLGQGWTPSEEDLRAAPRLDRWRIGTLGSAIAIRGFVTGHPNCADGVGIEVGPVLVFHDDGLWVRTLSRFYRLGPYGDCGWQ